MNKAFWFWSIGTIALCLVGLVACTNTEPISYQQMLITKCNAWIGTKNTLRTAVMLDKLSESDINTLEVLVPVADTFCSGPIPLDNQQAQLQLNSIQNAIDYAAVMVRENEK